MHYRDERSSSVGKGETEHTPIKTSDETNDLFDSTVLMEQTHTHWTWTSCRDGLGSQYRITIYISTNRAVLEANL